MSTDYKAPQVSSFFHECYLSLSSPPISEGRTWYMCVCYYDDRGDAWSSVVLFSPTGTAGAQWCTDLCNGHSKYELLTSVCWT